jgi:hypothetical protein
MMRKVSNGKVRGLVQSMVEFKANNIFSELNQNSYVVYSYGKHFPMYANVKGQWYKNNDRYSVSTSKHQSQSHPLVDCVEVSTSALKEIINLA